MTALTIIAIVVAAVAAAIAYLSYLASDRSAEAAERSAKAAESSDRRARTPNIAIQPLGRLPDLSERAIYRLSNEGPQDLDAVDVFRPRPPDGVTYPLMVTGEQGWADDEIRLGPLAMSQGRDFALGCGASMKLPDFQVRILCRAGPDEWPLLARLPPPR